MYYRNHDNVWEYIRNNTLRCIASYRRKMVGVILVNPDLLSSVMSSDCQYQTRESALASLKEDAYWDNAEVFMNP